MPEFHTMPSFYLSPSIWTCFPSCPSWFLFLCFLTWNEKHCPLFLPNQGSVLPSNTPLYPCLLSHAPVSRLATAHPENGFVSYVAVPSRHCAAEPLLAGTRVETTAIGTTWQQKPRQVQPANKWKSIADRSLQHHTKILGREEGESVASHGNFVRQHQKHSRPSRFFVDQES